MDAPIESVSIEVEKGVTLDGDLVIPPDSNEIVIFAHGSGSSRHSQRNKFVAEVLNKSGSSTLLFDLLTSEEDLIYENRFDISLLSKRLMAVTKRILRSKARGFKCGYFGASTGAAAALMAAAEMGLGIGAVVSRGGRPDLAGRYLSRVQSPTLLIVGGNDDVVIGLNEEAFKLLKGIKEMKIVAGAAHLFEEPGALEEVARLASEWFSEHLAKETH